jgi:hypothetical protein
MVFSKRQAREWLGRSCSGGSASRVCGAQVKGVRLVFSKREVDASSGEVYDGATEEEYPLDDFDVPLGDQD